MEGQEQPFVSIFHCHHVPCQTVWGARATKEGVTGPIPRLVDPEDGVCPVCGDQESIWLESWRQTQEFSETIALEAGRPYVRKDRTWQVMDNWARHRERRATLKP